MSIFKSAALAGVMLACALLPAKATTYIRDDNGGVIVEYVEKYSNLRDSGEKVIVDGDCISACTLMLGLLPKQQVCATKKAAFGFHSASLRIELQPGHPKYLHAREMSSLIWNLYPYPVRVRLKQLGWNGDHPEIPHPNLVFMRGKNLYKFVRKCNKAETPDA